MTRNLLILFILFFPFLKINAQCTPDNTITKAGFYPRVLPDAILNTPYSQVLQFKVFKDTMVTYAGFPVLATIDSATIIKVNGMPNGMTFVLNKKSKTYTPFETGCSLISGTPTQAGTFKLQIILNIYAKVGTFAVNQIDTIKSFSVVVHKDASSGELFTNQGVIFPNPLQGDFLSFKSDRIFPGTRVSISNHLGQNMGSFELKGDEKQIPFYYPRGIYDIRLNSETGMIHTRIIKQ